MHEVKYIFSKNEIGYTLYYLRFRKIDRIYVVTYTENEGFKGDLDICSIILNKAKIPCKQEYDSYNGVYSLEEFYSLYA